MVILVSTAILVVLSTNEAVFTSITIPVVLIFCPPMTQYLLVLPFLLILVSTATLVDRTSVEQEW
jgi:hypothetical protein